MIRGDWRSGTGEVKRHERSDYAAIPHCSDLAVQGTLDEKNYRNIFFFYVVSPLADEMDVQVFTINNDLCRERYEMLDDPWYVVTENMICVGILDVGGRDACQGDSGGPLYFQNILIGVISWGHLCANKTFPGVSVAVSSYINWIVETAVL
ncbi:trypsin, alkaline A-like [Ostrinia furnacalis]|uniref:trypsin, alkaline A-like n=1 Tax=Ostrinia furnacalis TaxID=93504 RepID=UPI00103ABDD4|nr:trypsin, alkaline A-like [Ostrinia furnacalis]